MTNNVDITIIHLSLSHNDDRLEVDRYVPVGTLYVVSMLEKYNFKVDFKDYQVYTNKKKLSLTEQLDINTFLSFIGQTGNVIGISCTSDLLPFTICAVKEIKKQFPGKKIILGGIGPSGVAYELMETFNFIDFVVIGEGENSTVNLLKEIRGKADYSSVPGIVYRENEKVIQTSNHQRISDLDIVPLPAYHHISFNDYNRVGVISTRGCPYPCTFCDSAPFWENIFTKRTVQNLIEEIEYIVDNFNLTVIDICDDLFFANKARCLEFCDELINRGIKIKWSCSVRVDLVDEPLIKKMAESGCTCLFFGVESGSDKVLSRIRKNITIDQAKTSILIARKYIDEVITSFMWGFPFESIDEFIETTEFLLFLVENGATPWFFMLCPFPLSGLYKEFYDRIGFSDELCSNMIGANMTSDMREMVLQYPSIFPGYYHYKSANLDLKHKVASQLGRPYLLPGEIKDIIESIKVKQDSLQQSYKKGYEATN
jgi:anaerobic magnesium-protoporphyrin IX monomethyl ester cyclase